jgi:YD repeat-containing protein
MARQCLFWSVSSHAPMVYRRKHRKKEGYDPNNNLPNVFENGKTNSWTFDAYDRVSSYRDPDGNLVQ